MARPVRCASGVSIKRIDKSQTSKQQSATTTKLEPKPAKPALEPRGRELQPAPQPAGDSRAPKPPTAESRENAREIALNNPTAVHLQSKVESSAGDEPGCPTALEVFKEKREEWINDAGEGPLDPLVRAARRFVLSGPQTWFIIPPIAGNLVLLDQTRRELQEHPCETAPSSASDIDVDTGP